jgi:hypothetical protein
VTFKIPTAAEITAMTETEWSEFEARVAVMTKADWSEFEEQLALPFQIPSVEMIADLWSSGDPASVVVEKALREARERHARLHAELGDVIFGKANT